MLSILNSKTFAVEILNYDHQIYHQLKDVETTCEVLVLNTTLVRMTE